MRRLHFTASRHGRWPVIAIAALAILGTIAGVVTQLGSGGGAAAAPTPVKTNTATVIRTDLSTTQQLYGSITFANSYAIVNPGGSSGQTVTQAQQAVATAQTNLTTAQTALSDTNSVNAQTVAQAQAALTQAQVTVTTDQAQQAADQQKLAPDTAQQRRDCAGPGAASAACVADGQQVSQAATKVDSDGQNLSRDTASLTSAQASVSVAQAKATQSADQAQANLNAANQTLDNSESQLATVSQNAVLSAGVYTQLPAVGQEIHQGQTLYTVDGRPVPLFYGTVTPWRDISPGISDGADVAQLEQNLMHLGFGASLQVSGHFGPAASDAVKRWQASLGVPQTGQVRLGEVIVAPEALRVTQVHVAAGMAIQPGQAVLDASGTNAAVTVALGVDKEYLVHDGDPVRVDLPDGRTTVSGRVTHIDSVATAVANPSQPGTPSTNPSNNGPQATVNVTIALEHFASEGPIDQQPVTVEITDQSAKGVLAVPVTALLALAGGGYGVKVVSGPTAQVVAVRTGLFASTLVQITGPGITAGTVVQVPSS
jgi:hypothetical protein